MNCPTCGQPMTLSSYMAGGGPVKYRTEEVWTCPTEYHPAQKQVREWDHKAKDEARGAF